MVEAEDETKWRALELLGGIVKCVAGEKRSSSTWVLTKTAGDFLQTNRLLSNNRPALLPRDGVGNLEKHVFELHWGLQSTGWKCMTKERRNKAAKVGSVF